MVWFLLRHMRCRSRGQKLVINIYYWDFQAPSAFMGLPYIVKGNNSNTLPYMMSIKVCNLVFLSAF